MPDRGAVQPDKGKQHIMSTPAITTAPTAAPTAPPVVETPKPAPPPVKPDTGDGKDPQAEAEKWKALARKHEDAAKANADKAKAFDAFEEASKSELEKAIARAEKAEAEAVKVRAEALRVQVAAAKGVPVDLLAGDTQEALEAAADKLLAFRGPAVAPDYGAGQRGGDVGAKTPQLTREDMKRMTPEQIVEAQNKGQFADVLGQKT